MGTCPFIRGCRVRGANICRVVRDAVLPVLAADNRASPGPHCSSLSSSLAGLLAGSSATSCFRSATACSWRPAPSCALARRNSALTAGRTSSCQWPCRCRAPPCLCERNSAPVLQGHCDCSSSAVATIKQGDGIGLGCGSGAGSGNTGERDCQRRRSPQDKQANPGKLNLGTH